MKTFTFFTILLYVWFEELALRNLDRWTPRLITSKKHEQ